MLLYQLIIAPTSNSEPSQLVEKTTLKRQFRGSCSRLQRSHQLMNLLSYSFKNCKYKYLTFGDHSAYLKPHFKNKFRSCFTIREN